MKDTDVARAVEFIAAELPREAWPHWNQGWPRESEAALLDAIFSSRAAYGTPKTGVRAVVDRWRTHRSVAAGEHLDNLSALAAFTDRGDELATVLGNRQRVPGNYSTKAEGVARAAKALVDAGCRSSADVEDTESLRSAVVSVPGLGPRTFETLVFLSGKLSATSIDLLARFATEASSSEDCCRAPTQPNCLLRCRNTSTSMFGHSPTLRGGINAPLNNRADRRKRPPRRQRIRSPNRPESRRAHPDQGGVPASDSTRVSFEFRARVAELADALDLGSSVSGRGGSSPPSRTTKSPAGSDPAGLFSS